MATKLMAKAVRGTLPWRHVGLLAAAVAGMAMLVGAADAEAHGRGGKRGFISYGYNYGYYAPPPVYVVRPAPVYYPPPAYYYAPPPPPAYYYGGGPVGSLNVFIPFRF